MALLVVQVLALARVHFFCESEGAKAFSGTVRLWRQITKHKRLTISTKRPLQQVGQFAVAERDMPILTGDCSNDIAQRGQTFVDALSLFQQFLVARASTFAETLGTRQIDQIQFAHSASAFLRVKATNLHREDGVTATGVGVALGRRGCTVMHRFFQ